MFHAESIQDTRPFFFESWEKHQQSKPVTPLEADIIEVMLAHPEYHKLFDNPALLADKTYFETLGDTNPFLHLGLHLAVREHIKTNRPPGLQHIYKTLIQHSAPLDAEHQLMQCLEACLWDAQQNKTQPNDHAYLAACHALIEP
jgi:hypothetical protein